MKVTVCELHNDPKKLEQDWQQLVEHVKNEKSELVLLPEMSFSPWIACTNHVDPDMWQMAVESHDQWLSRLDQLSASLVAGTRPVIHNQKRFNEAYIWEKNSGYQDIHHKYHLPNEEGFWEASWYDRGNGDFTVIPTTTGIIIGVLICTEMWFNEHARQYAKEGIHLLLCPRVTPQTSTEKWIAGGRTAAVISGAFCLSSNLIGRNIEKIDFGGTGWIIEPEEGDILGLTSPQQPFLTMDLDLKIAEKAKFTYPRYVQ